MAIDRWPIAGSILGPQAIEQAVVEDRRQHLERMLVARRAKASAGRPRDHRRSLPLFAAVIGQTGGGVMLCKGDRLTARRFDRRARRQRAKRVGQDFAIIDRRKVAENLDFYRPAGKPRRPEALEGGGGQRLDCRTVGRRPARVVIREPALQLAIYDRIGRCVVQVVAGQEPHAQALHRRRVPARKGEFACDQFHLVGKVGGFALG